ncbi:MAG: bestrophin family ion channel [Bacteroidota bacterium]
MKVNFQAVLMYVYKNFSLRRLVAFSGIHLLWLLLWAASVTLLYELTDWEWFFIPWLPLSLIGTAVAFYVGFKNNQSYGRLWEARKIWGAIVNSSRAWGSTVKGFVNDQFVSEALSPEEVYYHRQTLIYRQIAWLYALRSQLLIPTTWEHISQGLHFGRFIERRMNRFGIGLYGDDVTETQLKFFLPESEYKRLLACKNTATQIIDQQSQHLSDLRRADLIDDFRHVELQKILYDFYVHQGKCERIKKFPLPRQYGSMSMIFVGIFIFLLPFGMVAEFHKLLGESGTWLSIPFTALAGWVYLMMELVGDYSENPFEGLGNDIPMYSLCRTIEIDLREMLGESELPPAVEAKNGVLM